MKSASRMCFFEISHINNIRPLNNGKKMSLPYIGRCIAHTTKINHEDEFIAYKTEIKKKLFAATNCVKEIKASMHKNEINTFHAELLIKRLERISEKHGRTAPVRLKCSNKHLEGGEFKHDRPNWINNIFHHKRYKAECKAAAIRVNAEGSTVSAGEVIKTLNGEIQSAEDELKKLSKESAEYKKNIVNLKAELNAVNEQIYEIRMPAKIQTDEERPREL